MKSELNPKPARVVTREANIKHTLEDLGLSQRQFAEMIERPEVFVSELLNGKRQLTIDTVRRLEALFGLSAPFWMRLESNYRLQIEPADSEVLKRFEGRRIAA